VPGNINHSLARIELGAIKIITQFRFLGHRAIRTLGRLNVVLSYVPVLI